MKLRHHMILWIAGPTLAIYALILGIAGLSLYRQSMRETEQSMTRFAGSYSARLDGYLRQASRVAETTARFMRFADRLTDDEIYRQLETNVEQMSLIYGACVAFEPGTRKPKDVLFAPYVCRSDEGLRRVNIDKNVYDWYGDLSYTWYIRPKQLGCGVWSAPYFDKGAGGILMSTYSAPFSAEGAFGGVCTVDIDLPNLRETVGKEIQEDLDFVILTSEGYYAYHPDPSRIMSRTVVQHAHDDGRPALAALAPRMLSGQAGSGWIEGWDSDEPLGVFFAPVPLTGWVFACRMPAETVLRHVRRRMILGAAALLVAMLLMGGCIYFVAGRIAAPITSLERKVAQVSLGDLEARLDETASTVEIQKLARSFNKMTSDLRSHVERLASETAARQRAERDMDIARGIQLGLLPTSNPKLSGYDIAGWSKPADKTGGDYYDWQPLPDGRLAISLADVSGHGIGPALVTAVCRAYARASFPSKNELGPLMDRINDFLVEDLPAGRFVTFVVVVLQPSSGMIEVLSAGHGPLLLYRASSARVEVLEVQGLPFGIVSAFGYGPSSRLELSPGDVLVLTTDGFFEWSNPEGEIYGSARLERFVAAYHEVDPATFIQALRDDVLAFARGTPQADDLTAVVIRRNSDGR